MSPNIIFHLEMCQHRKGHCKAISVYKDTLESRKLFFHGLVLVVHENHLVGLSLKRPTVRTSQNLKRISRSSWQYAGIYDLPFSSYLVFLHDIFNLIRMEFNWSVLENYSWIGLWVTVFGLLLYVLLASEDSPGKFSGPHYCEDMSS